MNNYRVMVPSGNSLRAIEVRANTMDVQFGVLTFSDNKGIVQAFKEWVRVDRLI